MKVKDLCRSEYPAIRTDDAVRSAADRMKTHASRWLTVVTDSGVVGVVSDWDIITAVARGLDQDTTPVEAIMRVGIPSCKPDSSIEDAVGIMGRKHVRQVAVVDRQEGVIGIVRAEDLVRALDGKAVEADLLLEVFR